MALEDYAHLYPADEFPDLPDGLFWDIRESRAMKWRELQLRRKRLIGSKKVDWWVIQGGTFNKRGTVQDLRDWIRYAMRQGDVRLECQRQEVRNSRRKESK